MIPNYVRHSSFRRLARYLVTGRQGKARERVEWLSYRNIDEDMPWQVATAVCEATARSSPRSCKDPTLHFMWSPSPDDRRLSQREWEAIADRTLQTMGLDGHQAIIVEHNDTAYRGRPRPHLHMMVNAVHEDGRAWRKEIEKPDPARKAYQTAPGDSFWKTRLNMMARQLETEYGLKELDTPISAYWQGREWTRARSKSRAEREIDQRTGREADVPMDAADVKALGKLAKPIFLGAKSWEDLQVRLAEETGHTLKPKGQGLILRDPEGHYAKLSALGKVKLGGRPKAERLSKERLGMTFGEPFEDYWVRALDRTAARVRGFKSDTSLTPPERVHAAADQSQTGTNEDTTWRHQGLQAQVKGEGEQARSKPPEHDAQSVTKTVQQPAPEWHHENERMPDDLGAVLPAWEAFDREALARYKHRMATPLANARSWAHIERIAISNGLRLVGGWAMHDGARYLNLASIDGRDLKKRSARCGETYAAFKQRQATRRGTPQDLQHMRERFRARRIKGDRRDERER